jgi:hypothetical protein
MECSYSTIEGLRRSLLVEVNRLFLDSFLPFQHVEDEQCTGNLVALHTANHFLLDGNEEDMRGVPSHRLAAWMQTYSAGEALHKDIMELMRKVTAVIVVDGQLILGKYKELVVAEISVVKS